MKINNLCLFFVPFLSLFAKPVALKCDYRIDPLAVDIDRISFFWQNDQEDQVAYRLQVSSDELFSPSAEIWDSGEVLSSHSIQIAYDGPSLKSRTSYYWRVAVRSDSGEWYLSQVACFETAVDADVFWSGVDWISCDRSIHKPELAPAGWLGEWIDTGGQRGDALHYDFDLPTDKRVVYAGTYFIRSDTKPLAVKVNGSFSRYVNLNPKSYADFGHILESGNNTISVEMGKVPVGVAVALGMRILFADGSEQWIRSSSDWQTSTSTCQVRSDLRDRPQRVYPVSKLPPAWYKKSFNVTRSITKARLYYSGVGYAEAYVNGQAVSAHGMETGQSDYEAFAYFQTRDVTEYLQNDENILSFLLADGWYNQDQGFAFANFSYGKPAFIAKLVLEYSDGTSEVVQTDTSWKWAEGGIRYSNVYIGEIVDYRLARSDQFSSELTPEWKAVMPRKPVSPRLLAQDFEPVKTIRELEPRNIWQVGESTWLVQFPENFAGGLRLRFDESIGSEIRIRVSEYADLKSKTIQNVPASFWLCHGEMQNHLIIADGKSHTWEPRFSYHGFQYAEISGVSREPDVVALDIHSDVQQSAYFESDHPMLNRIFEMGLNSHYMNMHSILEDCPHREKCLWGGDLHSSWAFGYYALDSAAFYRQQARVFLTGKMKNGVPGVVGVGQRLTEHVNSISWSVSPFFLLYRNYQYYGDLATFERYYDRYLHFLNFFEEDSKDYIPQTSEYGDHADPLQVSREAPNSHLIGAINFYAAASRFAEMAEQLEGRGEDVAYALELAAKIKEAVNRQFFDQDEMNYGNATHSSLALALGIVPDAYQQEVAHGLIAYYEQNGKKFDGGFMSYNIYPWLSEAGASDLAFDMMTNINYPGPAFSIASYDATTFWERYILDKNERDPKNAKKLGLSARVSRAHHAMNHPSAWLINYIAGIQHDGASAGMQQFVLAPRFIVGVDEVYGSVKTLYGEIKSEWGREEGVLTWSFEVPPNTRALVRFSDQDEQVFYSGKYQLTL